MFGNGGSALTASHYVMDLVKTCAVPAQKRLQCFCLADNCGLTTALANDVSYDEVFVYPLATYARAGDVAVAIGCSGNSPNILKACEWDRTELTVYASAASLAGRWPLMRICISTFRTTTTESLKICTYRSATS